MKTQSNDPQDHKWKIDVEKLEILAEFAGGQGEMELVRAVVGAYLGAGPMLVVAMKSALVDQSWEKVAQIAHRLKSSSANVGACQFSELCGEIEDKARAGQLEHALSLSDQFAEAYYAGHRQLQKLVSLNNQFLRVLMVEDDMTLQPIWERLLKKLLPSHQLDWVISGTQALSKIAENSKGGTPYDLIVADVFLAGAQTGLDIFDQLAVDQRQHSPMILVSGVNRDKLMEYLQSYDHPPQLLTKPLIQKDCEMAIQHALDEIIAMRAS